MNLELTHCEALIMLTALHSVVDSPAVVTKPTEDEELLCLAAKIRRAMRNEHVDA